MKCSIVVPVYNALEFARACIDSIYQARTSMPFEVIVVDNGSRSDVREWLILESLRRANFRFLRFDQPLGFPRSVNEGARHARHHLLAVLNSDTLVYDGWLDMLAAALARDRVAIVGPVTNHCGHEAQTDSAAQSLDPAAARDYASTIHHRTPVNEPQRLVFFCAMVKRCLWLEWNGLDPAYSPGNFEDDDFCLRARLAGYRLAVARNVFVFHHARKTFQENSVEHGGALTRGQRIFTARAAAWSKTRLAEVPRDSIDNFAVIVPVLNSNEGLRNSLASLANQTVTGFEVIVVSAVDSPTPATGSLSLTRIRRKGNLPALLNAGIAAARGRRMAFLPAGDVYFPYHLEVLANTSAEAAYTAWSVAIGEVTGVVRFDQAAPQNLHSGDWAPLVCWTHSAPPPFDESLNMLCCWEWVMRLRARPRYLSRVTCEKRARAVSALEARRVIDLHPVGDDWNRHERRRFLAAVECGLWERTLIIQQNPVERRARQMLASTRLRLNLQELEAARTRFEISTAPLQHPRPQATIGSEPTILLFSIIRWTDLFQRPHHFARTLAARGFRVFWVDVQLKAPELAEPGNLAVEIAPNLYHISLPCAAGELYQLEWHPAVLDTMEAVFRCLSLSCAIQLVNFPKWTPLVRRLRDRFGWPIVYDCLDDQQAFGRMYPGNEAGLEDGLIADSAALITSGRMLYQRLKAKRPDTILIANAADFALFGSVASRGLLSHLPRPIIGFFGAFSDWLDFDWIRQSARRFPAWSFVYIGRDAFSSREMRESWADAVSACNIQVIGQQPLPTLARYCAEFDVCTMPFQDLQITRSMNAVKIYEYLAAGKPVVARDLPETRALAEPGLIDIYNSAEESFALLARAVASGVQNDKIFARRSFAAENNWSHRVDQLASVLGNVISNAPKP